MDNLTRKLRIYFGPSLGLLGAALNPEADEMSDLERIAHIENAIVCFRQAIDWYQNIVPDGAKERQCIN